MGRVKTVFFILFFAFFCTGVSMAHDENVGQKSIKGKINEIAADGSYILVDNLKILTSQDFLTESYLEVGDSVEIIAEDTSDGLKAIDYYYVFEDLDDDFWSKEQDESEKPLGEENEDEEAYTY